jgi:hypothetical protein
VSGITQIASSNDNKCESISPNNAFVERPNIYKIAAASRKLIEFPQQTIPISTTMDISDPLLIQS